MEGCTQSDCVLMGGEVSSRHWRSIGVTAPSSMVYAFRRRYEMKALAEPEPSLRCPGPTLQGQVVA